MAIKKCQPGVVCVENVTMVFIICGILITVYLLYIFYIKPNSMNNIIIKEKIQYTEPNIYDTRYNLMPKPNYAYSNLPNDVFLNPYVPPLKDERYFTEDIARWRVPINMSTNPGAVDTSYRQVGLLTPFYKGGRHNNNNNNTINNGKILPLMGRPLFTNRDKWQYYSLSDQNNSIKLPVLKNGKSCTNEYGCNTLYDGDVIFVEGYKEAFKITMYDTDTIKYLPFL